MLELERLHQLIHKFGRSSSRTCWILVLVVTTFGLFAIFPVSNPGRGFQYFVHYTPAIPPLSVRSFSSLCRLANSHFWPPELTQWPLQLQN